MNDCDNKFKLSYNYNLLGDLIQATDEVNNISIQRTIDPCGNILSEKLSTGLAIQKNYDAFDRPLSIVLPDRGQILYPYDPLFLRAVSRTSPSGEILYTHRYLSYDSSGYLKEEKLIGELESVKHVVDMKGRKISIASPYFKESYSYDEIDNLIEITTNDHKVQYGYDELNQLITEAENTYVYDTNFNRIEENRAKWTSNELDELLSTQEAQCTYDLNGNLLSKKTSLETLTFTYDPLDRLLQVITNTKRIEMSYDPLGRRLCKNVNEIADSGQIIENYLYDGENDIGTFTSAGTPLHQRVLGLASHKNTSSTIAIELGGQVFAPVQDFQGNIRQLICPFTRKKIAEYQFSAFGKLKFINESTFNPWRYASKRLDLETNLINFGKRFYDAELCRWTTTDPAGFIDGMNLYGYVKNNPYRYTDPNGLFAFPLIFLPAVFEISFAGIVSWISVEAVIGAVVGATVGIGIYQIDKAINDDNQDIAINNEAIIEEVETEKKKKKSGDIYAPSRPLPMTKPGGVPIPDTDAPHTQLGTREGSKGKYPQAREFDENGKPVRTLDFTDHGRPHDHMNPHQHVYKPNPTGGTPGRENAEPLPGWIY